MLRSGFSLSLLPIILILFSTHLPFHLVAAQTSTTVIDILSQNVEFSYFLRLLQKNQLIPFLNRLNNITLAAPVNSAFVNQFCSDEAFPQCLDQFNKIDLGAYIIDSPISSNDFAGYRIYQSVVDEDFTEPFPSPILASIDPSNKFFRFNNIDVVEPDLFANSQDAYVQGIDQCFESISLDKAIKEENNTNTSFLYSLLETYNEPLDDITLLIPSYESFELKYYEKNYLQSEYATEDREIFLNSLIIDGYYGGKINATAQDRNGYIVEISSDDQGEHIILNNTIESISKVGVAKNALFYTFDNNDLIPSIEFNPMKVLIGLGATSFVDELLLQNLSHLITNNSLEQTIFYAKDPSQISINSKSSNLYHFIEERIDDLSKAKSLYNTRFCSSKKFGSSCQKIKIESVGENSYMLNNNILIESGPIRIGNTVIYLTDDNVRTPHELLSSVNPVFHCTKSMNLLFESKLTKFENNGLGYTVFLPCYNSYKDFELTLNYLKKDKKLMNQVLKHFIIEGLVYSDIEREAELINLNKEKILIHEIYRNEENVNLRLNNDSLVLKHNDDILFNQGVVHPVNKLIIPENIIISLENIIESSIGSETIFLEFLKQFDLFNEILKTESEYSILIPHSYRLKPFDSNSTLEKFLKIHTIPKVSLNNLYKCDGENDIETLDPKVNLTCTRVSDNNLFLSIKNGAENGVNVFSRGCTNNEDRSCIYLIDKPLNLKWIDNDSHYHISLPGIALSIGILLGSLLMVLILSCLMLVVLRKKKITSNEDEAQTDSDENTNLINEQENNSTTYYNTTENFEAGYSGNAHIDPINFPQKKTHSTT